MNHTDRKVKSKVSKKKAARRRKLRKIGIGLVILQVIAACVFMWILGSLKMIPMEYLYIAGGLLFLISAYNMAAQFTRHPVMGRIMAGLLELVLTIGSVYAVKTNDMLATVTGVNTVTEQVSFLVRANDKASQLSDTDGYAYGCNEKDQADMTKAAVDYAQKQTGRESDCKQYDNVTALIHALDKKDTDVILFPESMRPTIEEQDTEFSTKTKVIDTFEYKYQLTIKGDGKDLSKTPFTVYISGNDDYGKLTDTGRSDVNIIATFNPKTRQVLLVSTPRDYWIEVDSTTGQKGYEKLTHAGNYGIHSSMETLSQLYGINIDYYLKVNFDGAVGVIDALKGITIQSDVDFTNGADAAPVSYHFTIGENECDGAKALAFCRERHTFSDGDNQRGKNQMQAMKAIISKATSPSILSNYSGILNAVTQLIATDIPQDSLASLVRSQLSDHTEWNVSSYSATGTGATRTGELFGLKGMSVMIPDQTSVDRAKELMQQVRDGQTITLD